MDRVTVYPRAVPRTEDFLRSQKNAMTAIGALGQAVLGTAIVADGFTLTPTNPASLNVVLGPGSVYQIENADTSAWSILPADTTLVQKQGILSTAAPITLTSPATVGYAQNFLIQVQYEDLDDSPVVLQYYNSLNPAQPLFGSNNAASASSGLAQSTRRAGIVAYSAKAAAAATSGSQVTPTPDAGWAGLFVVTVAYGQTAVTVGNISQYRGAPLITTKLPQIPSAVQAGTWTYCRDQGVANAVVINPTPAITQYLEGQGFRVRMAYPPTGATTINISGLGTFPLVGPGNTAIAAGAWAANDIVAISNNGSAFQVTASSGSGSGGSGGSVSSYAQLITSNLTLNVPTTSYPTIQAAVLAAGQMFISPNVFVTIQVAAGYIEQLTSSTGPIILSHPHGQRIRIIGAPLNGAFPTYSDLAGLSNANALTLLQSRFQVKIQCTGTGAFALQSGAINSIQNILVIGDQLAAGGFYGIKVGDWSTQVGTGSIGLQNMWVHGFGLDNIRAEESSVIQAINVGSTYSSAHCFHVSHYSVLECNTGNLCAMYGQVGIMLQNAGQLAIDSASGTIDVAYNTMQGIGSPDYGIVNAYSATGVRIRNNGTWGINMALFSVVALPSNGGTTFGSNASGDIFASYYTTVVTYGCSLPGGSSPGRGSTGNVGASVV